MPFMPSAALLSNQGGYFPVGTPVRYVAASGGSNGNDGLSPKTAMSSIQFAYDSLSSEGGTIVLLPGIYSVDGYTNGRLTLSATKPCVFTSVSGERPRHSAHLGGTYGAPQIVGTGSTLILITSSFEIGQGMGFYGIHFDMRNTSVLCGIAVRDMNYLQVVNCGFEGGGQSGWAIRTWCISFDDTSWHRIYNNYCRVIGLIEGLSQTTFLSATPIVGGNNNNVQVTDNIVFGNPVIAISMYNLQRSVIEGNNIESSTTGVKLWDASHKNAITWQGGEGSPTPYLEFDGGGADAGAYGNYYLNFAMSGGTAVVDGAAASDYASPNYGLVANSRGAAEKIVDYSLTAGQWFEYLFIMNKATAIGFFIDRQATVPIGIGATFTILQQGAGAVTVTKHAAVTINGQLTTTNAGDALRFIKTDVNTWYSYRTTS